MVSQHGSDGYDREEYANEQRQASATTYVGGLDEVPRATTDDYWDTTVTIDETTYAPFAFTKGMPLDTDDDDRRYPEGVVPKADKEARYQERVETASGLEEALGDGDAFKQGGDRLFIGVPGVQTVGLAGPDVWDGRMPAPPDPTGDRNAAEMIDVYAMEQLRDVPFTAWPNEQGGDGPATVDEILSDDTAPAALRTTIEALQRDFDRGMQSEAWYSPDRLFVEAAEGNDGPEEWGPYVSQFLLHDINMWSLPVEQRYLRYDREVNYNGYPQDWLDTLEGHDEVAAETNPKTPSRENRRGYVSTPRHLATIVNAEPPYQEYFIAATRLLGVVDFDEGLSYVSRDDPPVFNYTDSGPVGLFDMLARAAREALLAAFYQKYHRFRCRPETYGGRLHAQRRGKRDFGIPDLLAGSAVLDARSQGTDLLTTAYEEGSPVHPAYPSGHSVIAGACGTVLKTWFQDPSWEETGLAFYVPAHEDGHYGAERGVIDPPSGHDGVHQEIDKLMSNVGLARMFAGVHYYSDHRWGVKLGEQIATGLMADVFDRGFVTVEEGNGPTFSPFLEPGTERAVTAGTFETIRKNAAEVGTLGKSGS